MSEELSCDLCSGNLWLRLLRTHYLLRPQFVRQFYGGPTEVAHLDLHQALRMVTRYSVDSKSLRIGGTVVAKSLEYKVFRKRIFFFVNGKGLAKQSAS